MQYRIALSGALLVVCTLSAHAENLRFSGLAVGGCVLGAPTEGLLQQGADLSSWSTLAPATITAINTGPAVLSITKPVSWSSAPGGTPSTTFGVSAVTTGANAIRLDVAGQAGNISLALLGANLLSVALTASADTPYRTGLHTAEVTVTCSVP